MTYDRPFSRGPSMGESGQLRSYRSALHSDHSGNDQTRPVTRESAVKAQATSRVIVGTPILNKAIK
jgi:hypothetical protein